MILDTRAKQEFGQVLRTYRRTADLSQGHVSTELGFTSPQYLSNIERGIAEPSLELIKKLIELYEVPRKDLTTKYGKILNGNLTRGLK